MQMALNLSCLPHLYPKRRIIPRNPLQTGPLHSPQVICCSVPRTQISSPSDQGQSANYQSTIWSYDFLQSLKNDHAETLYKAKAEKLEEQVRRIINNESADSLTILQFIDDIQRLGLRHRFEGDIRGALHRYISSGGCNVGAGKSLYATALSFRLLRQHGFEVSQDVFNAFKDHKGNFMAGLCMDVKGLLSLYEASYLRFEGEDLLDEALAFTRMHLKDLQSKIVDLSTSEQVSHALELPFHHRVPWRETRWHIEEYNTREDAAKNSLLLELAKLDFNMVQSILQTDLQDMSRWWKDMGLAKKMSFARDRLMECFFWSAGMISEPQFSDCRKGLTKVTALITTIDDVYDVYGTLDELELFTDAVQRWDLNAVNDLPDYSMKLCFLALYNTVNEMAYDTLNEHGQNILPYLRKVWADMCKAFLQEAKWRYNKSTPKFNDYFENAWLSVSGVVILVHAYFLMAQNISTEAIKCLEDYNNILRWPSVIFRLCNDLGTSMAEFERGECANSILCYMLETDCSEEIAREHICNMIDETWKNLNEGRVGDSPFPKHFVETTFNLARISQCTYQHGDAHGAPDERSKNLVLSLIIEPISLPES